MLLDRACINQGFGSDWRSWLDACERYRSVRADADPSSEQLARALAGSPPIRAIGRTEVALTPYGGFTRQVALIANGRALDWIVDSGAGVTTLSETTAIAIGIRRLGTVSGMGTATDLTVSGWAGMVNRVVIGGAVVENLPVMILSDADLTFDGRRVSGILGLPALVAFGRVAWLDGGARLRLGGTGRERGARHPLYWHDAGIGIPFDTPYGRAGGQFDSGTGHTTLMTPLLAMMPAAEVSALPERRVAQSGAGGTTQTVRPVMPNFAFRALGIPLTATDATIDTRTNEGIGRVGDDLIRRTRVLALDFRGMQATVRAADD